MRIRSLKPEFWRSDDIDGLVIEDRFLFVGLWSYVDDNGVGRDKLAEIAADLFAGDLERDPRETFARVSRGLQNLAAAGLISRYNVSGRSYLHVTTWEKHQRIDRPNKQRYPLPTCEDADPRETLAESSRDPRANVAAGAVEQGNRGTGEGAEHASADSGSPPLRDDVDRICRHLSWCMVQNGCNAPTIGKTWHDAARLMLDKDKRPEALVHEVIDWCQADEFWRANIQSLPTLRGQFDKLRLQMPTNNVHHLPFSGPDGYAVDDKRR